MEIPTQEWHNAFSEMSKLYPSIPQDVVKMYIQECSNDIEKCSQMLNVVHSMYSDIQSLPAACDSVSIAKPPLNIPLSNSENICDNFNEVNSTEPLLSPSITDSDLLNQNILAYDQSNIQSEPCPDLKKADEFVLDNGSNIDRSSDLNGIFVSNEPLELHISVDEENDSLHSWRPNMSNNLCPDFFLPSLAVETFQMSHNQASSTSNLDFQQNISQVQVNPEGLEQQPWNSGISRQMFHGYFPKDENSIGINFENHLHFQKCQMNAIRYEVIKAKIELGEVLESVEKLTHEMKEKSKAENIQDIDQLNNEIVQLRLECQSLCSEVDFYNKDKALLGETDESFYSNQDESSTGKSDLPDENSNQDLTADSNDITEELQLWECPKCTFNNHPAMSLCEICQGKRPSTKKPSHLRTHENYRQPKKGSLSIPS